MARTSYFSMRRWWWCLLCNGPIRLVGSCVRATFRSNQRLLTLLCLR